MRFLILMSLLICSMAWTGEASPVASTAGGSAPAAPKITKEQAVEIAKTQLAREPFARDIDSNHVTITFRDKDKDYWVDFDWKGEGEIREELRDRGYHVIVDSANGTIKESGAYKR